MFYIFAEHYYRRRSSVNGFKYGSPYVLIIFYLVLISINILLRMLCNNRHTSSQPHYFFTTFCNTYNVPGIQEINILPLKIPIILWYKPFITFTYSFVIYFTCILCLVSKHVLHPPLNWKINIRHSVHRNVSIKNQQKYITQVYL